MSRYSSRIIVTAALLCGGFPTRATLRGDDWPQFGRDGTRNAVSPERHPPTSWDIGKFDTSQPPLRIKSTQRNIKWSARLGTMTYGDPVVVNGLIWVGTNNWIDNSKPRQVDASVLTCLRERDGKLLYRYVSPRLPQGREHDWPSASMACSPLIDNDRLWFVTNRAEVVCLDIAPLYRDESEPKVVWKVDLIGQFGVFPRGSVMAIAHLCSIAGYKDFIYLITSNGVDEGYKQVPKPDAPSLICFRKETGEVVWHDHSPGRNILYAQWSSPTIIEVNGRAQCIAPQGDGWIRSFDAITGRPIWQFDINGKATSWRVGGNSSRNSILSSPVFANGCIYIASGHHPEWGEGAGRLVCLDPTKEGDISSELAVDAQGNGIPHRRVQAVDPATGEMAIPNPNSGMVWEFTHTPDRDPFENTMYGTVSNVAVHNDLLIAADLAGLVHCLNAKTGQRYWVHDLMATCFASPLIVDGKIFVVDEDGDVSIFGLSPDPHVALSRLNGEFRPLRENPVGGSGMCSPIFANGVLYVATRSELFAIAAEQDEPELELASGYWPQWRGPNRDNVSLENGLLQEWPEAGPPLRWQVEGIGEGIASVSIAEGRIFTAGYAGESEYAIALEQRTGEKLWSTPIGRAVKESSLMRWLSQRSPTIDGERAYFLTAGGDLVCLASRDGRELWRMNYLADFAGKHGWWGYCDYPLVDGEYLICTPGGPSSTIIALNKVTGEVLWTSGIPEAGAAAYAAMVVSNAGGVRQYVTFLEKELVGVAAKDGQLLWRYDKLASDQNSFTPIVLGDQILGASGRKNAGIALLKLTATGQRLPMNEQYFKPLNLNHFQDNLLVLGGHVYGTTRNGLVCVSLATGDVHWEGPRQNARYWMSALLAADGHLYVRQSDGVLKLIEARSDRFVPKGSLSIPDHQPSIGATHPVIAGGRLYLRDEQRLFCYDLRNQVSAAFKPDVKTIKIDVTDSSTAGVATDQLKARTLRSVFVATPHDVVDKMLELADVKKSDVVYDLGSGDGRIVISAAKKYGCQAVGYEIDKDLVELSRKNSESAGVRALVTIEPQDLFTADLRKADVVAVYLLPKQLEKLMPQLQQLKPGARIVSHYFALSDIPPDKTVKVQSPEDSNEHTIYLWTLPLKRER